MDHRRPKIITLSMEELKDISICAAKEIAERKPVDLVVYIARAGFPLAYYMNAVFQCRLLGVKAVRKGNRVKSIVGKLLSYTPAFFKDFLRNLELRLGVHKKYSHRCVEFHASLQEIDRSLHYSILVVDDSVDTGSSMKQVTAKIAETFPDAEITTYALNVFKESREQIAVDGFAFQDAIIRTPMSKDSVEYKAFCSMYRRETRNEYL